MGVVLSWKTASLKARIFKRAFIAVLACRSICHVGIDARALIACIFGAYISVVAGLIVTALPFAGVRAEVAGALLSAVQVAGALDANKLLGAFSAGTLSVFVALDARVGDRVALRATTVCIV